MATKKNNQNKTLKPAKKMYVYSPIGLGGDSYKVELQFEEYENGRTCIELVEVGTGDYVACATVNLPDEWLEDGQVIVKNYSENEGMLQFLIDNKIVGEAMRAAGNINAPVCKLLVTE